MITSNDAIRTITAVVDESYAHTTPDTDHDTTGAAATLSTLTQLAAEADAAEEKLRLAVAAASLLPPAALAASPSASQIARAIGRSHTIVRRWTAQQRDGLAEVLDIDIEADSATAAQDVPSDDDDGQLERTAE